MQSTESILCPDIFHHLSCFFQTEFTVCLMRHYFVNDCKSLKYEIERICGEDILRGVINIIVIAEFQILCLIVWSLDLKMAQLMLDLVYFVFYLDDVLVVVRAQQCERG